MLEKGKLEEKRTSNCHCVEAGDLVGTTKLMGVFAQNESYKAQISPSCYLSREGGYVCEGHAQCVSIY